MENKELIKLHRDNFKVNDQYAALVRRHVTKDEVINLESVKHTGVSEEYIEALTNRDNLETLTYFLDKISPNFLNSFTRITDNSFVISADEHGRFATIADELDINIMECLEVVKDLQTTKVNLSKGFSRCKLEDCKTDETEPKERRVVTVVGEHNLDERGRIKDAIISMLQDPEGIPVGLADTALPKLNEIMTAEELEEVTIPETPRFKERSTADWLRSGKRR